MTGIAWPGGIRPTGAVCLDFEFKAEPGNPISEVHCMVARCVVTGRTWRLWGDELKAYPFRGDEIFIAYYASAEMACFRSPGLAAPALCARPVRRVPQPDQRRRHEAAAAAWSMRWPTSGCRRSAPRKSASGATSPSAAAPSRNMSKLDCWTTARATGMPWWRCCPRSWRR